MTTLRSKIQKQCKEKKAPQYIIEKDYALSYILAGITQNDVLKKSLVFKGGTALKKMYFGDYRFSEDLDFSAKNGPTGIKLKQALKNAVVDARNMLNAHGPFNIELNKNPEKSPHPNGQDAFIANVKFPWHPHPMCRIKIEITQDEPIILTSEHRMIIHEYDENFNYTVPSYQISEIVAEKLRALLQTHEKLITRGWTRSRPRDYYDLWRILKDYANTIDPAQLLTVLEKKCLLRKITFSKIDDFFTKELLHETSKNWQGSLGALMQDLPDAKKILTETRSLVNRILL